MSRSRGRSASNAIAESSNSVASAQTSSKLGERLQFFRSAALDGGSCEPERLQARICPTAPGRVVGHFEFRFLYGPRFSGTASGSISTISMIVIWQSMMPAAIAGVVFRVMCCRMKLWYMKLTAIW